MGSGLSITTFVRTLWPFLVILTAYGLDRVSKWWAADFLAQNGPTELHSLLSIKLAYNRGIGNCFIAAFWPNPPPADSLPSLDTPADS